jgi:hypothetical protein
MNMLFCTAFLRQGKTVQDGVDQTAGMRYGTSSSPGDARRKKREDKGICWLEAESTVQDGVLQKDKTVLNSVF